VKWDFDKLFQLEASTNVGKWLRYQNNLSLTNAIFITILLKTSQTKKQRQTNQIMQQK